MTNSTFVSNLVTDEGHILPAALAVSYIRSGATVFLALFVVFYLVVIVK